MSEAFKYQGDELELFQHAKNWKSYFSKQLKKHINGKVLEVGAGIGATTILLNDGSAPTWTLLEPDKRMSDELRKRINAKELPANCNVQQGTIDDLREKFDTIIYIDVLEHIGDDRQELAKAAGLLNKEGRLIVLSPAHQSLYNPFDKAIGHFRRYTKKTISSLTPPELKLIECSYLDSIGYFAAAGNKLMLRKKYPTQKQVLFWDRFMVPVSRVTDKLFFHSFGKSIIAVWQSIPA